MWMISLGTRCSVALKSRGSNFFFFFFFFFFFTVLELKHHEMKRYGSPIKNRSGCVKMVLPLREDDTWDTEESVLIRYKRDKKNKRPGRGLT